MEKIQHEIVTHEEQIEKNMQRLLESPWNASVVEICCCLIAKNYWQIAIKKIFIKLSAEEAEVEMFIADLQRQQDQYNSEYNIKNKILAKLKNDLLETTELRKSAEIELSNSRACIEPIAELEGLIKELVSAIDAEVPDQKKDVKTTILQQFDRINDMNGLIGLANELIFIVYKDQSRQHPCQSYKILNIDDTRDFQRQVVDAIKQYINARKELETHQHELKAKKHDLETRQKEKDSRSTEMTHLVSQTQGSPGKKQKKESLRYKIIEIDDKIKELRREISRLLPACEREIKERIKQAKKTLESVCLHYKADITTEIIPELQMRCHSLTDQENGQQMRVTELTNIFRQTDEIRNRNNTKLKLTSYIMANKLYDYTFFESSLTTCTYFTEALKQEYLIRIKEYVYKFIFQWRELLADCEDDNYLRINNIFNIVVFSDVIKQEDYKIFLQLLDMTPTEKLFGVFWCIYSNKNFVKSILHNQAVRGFIREHPDLYRQMFLQAVIGENQQLVVHLVAMAVNVNFEDLSDDQKDHIKISFKNFLYLNKHKVLSYLLANFQVLLPDFHAYIDSNIIELNKQHHMEKQQISKGDREMSALQRKFAEFQGNKPARKKQENSIALKKYELKDLRQAVDKLTKTIELLSALKKEFPIQLTESDDSFSDSEYSVTVEPDLGDSLADNPLQQGSDKEEGECGWSLPVGQPKRRPGTFGSSSPAGRGRKPGRGRGFECGP